MIPDSVRIPGLLLKAYASELFFLLGLRACPGSTRKARARFFGLTPSLCSTFFAAVAVAAVVAVVAVVAAAAVVSPPFEEGVSLKICCCHSLLLLLLLLSDKLPFLKTSCSRSTVK